MDEASDRDGGSEGTHSITVSAAQVSQLAQQIVSLRGGIGGNQQVTVLQLPSGEQVQVHGVIQAAAAPPSVIRSPAPQHAQQQLEEATDEEQADSQQLQRAEDSTQKAARELLARRPSYRKILKELSGGGERGEEEQQQPLQHLQPEEQEGAGASTGLAASMAAATTTIYQTSTGQYFAIAPNGALQFASPATDAIQGLQTLNMGGGELHQHLGGGGGGTTILQYAQTSDGQQILVPSNQVVVQTPSGDMQTYQIRTTTSGGTTTTSLPQTVLMSSPLALSSAAAANAKTVDPQLKREIRLMKNMEAARECRRKKKEYVKCLENRVAVLENQNRTLIEELKTLKDLYCHK